MKKLGVKSYGGFGWEKYLQLDSDIQREPLLAYGSVATLPPFLISNLCFKSFSVFFKLF